MQALPFASGFSVPASAAIWVTVASIAASLILLLYTLELRLRRRIRERRRAGVLGLWRALLADAVTGRAGTAPPPLRRRERHEFLRLWVYTRSMLEGAAAERLIALADSLELREFVREQAERPRSALPIRRCFPTPANWSPAGHDRPSGVEERSGPSAGSRAALLHRQQRRRAGP